MKEDLGFSAVELAYGPASCLPGELFSPPPILSHPYFVYKLQATVKHLKSLPKSTHGWRAIAVSDQLINCLYMFIHSAHVTLSLLPIYFCLFVVKQRTDKYFDIAVNGTIRRISINRLKSYFLLKVEADNSHLSIITKEPTLVISAHNHQRANTCYIIWQSIYSTINLKRYLQNQRKNR